MQNGNVKLNQILGILLAVLCIVIIFLLYKRQTYDVNQYVNDSLSEEDYYNAMNEENIKDVVNETKDSQDITPTVQKAFVETKIQTGLGGLGCFVPAGVPCNDTPPTHVTLNGYFKSNDKKTTIWFEYWRHATNTSPEGEKIITTKQVHSEQALNVSQYITNLDAGYTYSFRLVAENSSGVSYGAPITFSIPIP